VKNNTKASQATTARKIRIVCERQIHNTDATYGSCLMFTTTYNTKRFDDTKGIAHHNTTRINTGHHNERQQVSVDGDAVFDF